MVSTKQYLNRHGSVLLVGSMYNIGLHIAALVISLACLWTVPACVMAQSNSDPSTVTLENAVFELRISLKDGLDPRWLRNKQTGTIWANTAYYYGFGRPQNVSVKIQKTPDGHQDARFTGTVGSLSITHRFIFPSEKNWFEEQICVTNITDKEISFAENLNAKALVMRSGFNLSAQISSDNFISGFANKMRLIPVPYRRATCSGAVQDRFIKNMFMGGAQKIGSEGWIITDDHHGLLVIKYNQQMMEYSIVDTAKRSDSIGQIFPPTYTLRFGGCGILHGDPESAFHLLPRQTLSFGVTRYTAFSGSWKKGFLLFRRFMDARGHRFPSDFNPPVHWNEIYDNPLWWNAPDTEEKRAQFYRLADIEKEAAKARELGCEALYLDPGWDTHFGSTLWDEDRLLKCREFCRKMQNKYGLKVSLHTPLAQWNIYLSYPRSALARNDIGHTYRNCNWLGFDYALCSGAPGWWDAKLKRLLQLAKDGISFFMFDGTAFTGHCCDPNHGHPVPYTREAQIKAYAELARRIHQQYPKVLIEMHDQVFGASCSRYVPTYYTQGPDTFDCIWAFEYMWDPMDDLISGKSLSLYYYNLAYNIPLYDHINLKTDNTNALVFWWTASTCRYLGVGGKDGVKASTPQVEIDLAHLGVGEKNSPPPKIWQVHQKAMKEYLRLKPFFAHGEFYGINELTHIHTISENNAAVITCFNLKQKTLLQKFNFRLSEIGLNPRVDFELKGADTFDREVDQIRVGVTIPARGVKILELQSAKKRFN